MNIQKKKSNGNINKQIVKNEIKTREQSQKVRGNA
jgi:hypothetical protein